MNIEEKLTKVSMFLDGELTESGMNNVEKIIDNDDEIKSFIINSVKTTAYSKSFFRNEIDKDEINMPDNQKKFGFRILLQAASVILLLGIGVLAGTLLNNRSGANFVLADNIINPAYQNILNTALENYKSGEPYKTLIPELDLQVTIIPEKTYKYNNRFYIRKFVITYDIAGKSIGINGFAERKGQQSWEIKTLEF